MNYRLFARLGRAISEVGCGTWGMGGWTGSDDSESAHALDCAVARGCNTFDTALAYGDGRSERLVGSLVSRQAERRLFIATKVPPKNGCWPGRASDRAAEVFPAEHIIDSTRASLRNLGVETIDLQQLHVWDDSWTGDDGWKQAVEQLKRQGLIRAFGISVNRWEPENVVHALETGLVDAVQVVYNVFDQAPEDVLFPECRSREVSVFARVPFDEGSLSGSVTLDSRWPDGDWRNLYFTPSALHETLQRLAPIEKLATAWRMTLPELALRFVLSNPAVTTVIPGMRRARHVGANLGVSEAGPLTVEQLAALRSHRWDRQPHGCP